jgi:hypothetical protein
VTSLFIASLESLVAAAESARAGDLLDSSRNPGVSANFCESVLMLRPAGDRSNVSVSVAWSRFMMPLAGEPSRRVQLSQAVFEVAEAIAPRLRTPPRLGRHGLWAL